MAEKHPPRRSRRKASLPRLTVLAMSKRDLVAFVSAVETLSLVARDLQVAAEEIKAERSRRRPGRRRSSELPVGELPAGDVAGSSPASANAPEKAKGVQP